MQRFSVPNTVFVYSNYLIYSRLLFNVQNFTTLLDYSCTGCRILKKLRYLP